MAFIVLLTVTIVIIIIIVVCCLCELCERNENHSTNGSAPNASRDMAMQSLTHLTRKGTPEQITSLIDSDETGTQGQDNPQPNTSSAYAGGRQYPRHGTSEPERVQSSNCDSRDENRCASPMAGKVKVKEIVKKIESQVH